MGFDAINALGQQFAETNMGETFSYTDTNGVSLTGLRGVFSRVDQFFNFEDVGMRKVVSYSVITSCAQWGNEVPTNNGTVTDSSGQSYNVDDVQGVNTAGDPAFEITLMRLT